MRRTSWVVRAKAVLRILEVYPSMKQFEKIAQIVSAWKAGREGDSLERRAR